VWTLTIIRSALRADLVLIFVVSLSAIGSKLFLILCTMLPTLTDDFVSMF
jgi:hypothetical protein